MENLNLHSLSAADIPAHTQNAPNYTSATGNADAATVGSSVAAATRLPLVDQYGNPTEEQIRLWQAQHGRKIKQVEVGMKVVCFIQPPRAIVEAALEVLQKTKKPLKYAETIMSNCQLNYIQETKEDEELFHALAGVIDQVVSSLTASLKN